MRRYFKYLIIIGTPIILLMSFSLFYFNDSLLADSFGRFPAHLGIAEVGAKQAQKVHKVDHVSRMKSHQNDLEVQSNEKLALRHAKGGILSQALQHLNRSVIEESMVDSVVDVDKALKGKENALIQKAGNILMNGNKVLNSSINKPANVVGHVLSHNGNSNTDGISGRQAIQRRVKGGRLNGLLSNYMLNSRKSRGTPLRSNQQLNEQSSHNYTLSSPCSDPLCTEFLSERDLGNFTTCKHRAEATYSRRVAKSSHTSTVTHLAARFSRGLLQPSGECRFMNGSGRSPVGLVSFPGSGNTWVRGLLQKATGICTGAVYCDRMLRMGGFDGEGVQSGAVLVVKTHSPTPLWTKVKRQLEFNSKGRPYFDSVVLVVRNPFHALISEWNRELSTKGGLGQGNGTAHTNVFGQEYFLTYSHWTKFVEEQIERWKVHFDWLLKHPKDRDVILVRYEDLKRDLLPQIERILMFLHFSYTNTELSARLSQDFSLFQRLSKPNFDHFTSKQKEQVNTVIKSISQRLHDTFGTTYNIEEYNISK